MVIGEDYEETSMRIIHSFDTDSSLRGEWASNRCETRPRSLFLTREIDFRAERQWKARYRFFLDELCSKPHFSVAVTGRYKPGGRSLVVPGGWQLDLNLLNATVTPESDQMTAELSTSGCGTTPWKTREPQELKFGCSAIGLKVPANTKELARIEESPNGLILLLGLAPSNAAQQQMAGSRQVQMTSFDAPLHKAISEAMKPLTDVSSKESPTRPQDAPISRPAFTSAKTQNRLPAQYLHLKPTKAVQSPEDSSPRLAAALLQSPPGRATSAFSSFVLLSILATFQLLL